LRQIEDGVFAADVGDALFASVGGGKVGGVALDNGVAEFVGAADGGVFAEVGFDGGDGSIFDVTRRLEVRLACAEVDDVNSLLGELIGFGDDGLSVCAGAAWTAAGAGPVSVLAAIGATCRLLITCLTPGAEAAYLAAASRSASLSTVPESVTAPFAACTVSCLFCNPESASSLL
jgi:hypothetical protein